WGRVPRSRRRTPRTPGEFPCVPLRVISSVQPLCRRSGARALAARILRELEGLLRAAWWKRLHPAARGRCIPPRSPVHEVPPGAAIEATLPSGRPSPRRCVARRVQGTSQSSCRRRGRRTAMKAAKNGKGSRRVEARRIAPLVERAVDDGAESVEEIHRSIASMPLDVLERLDLFKETVKDVRKVQDSSIGAIYDLIHKVNREVGKIAVEMLRPAGARKVAPRK